MRIEPMSEMVFDRLVVRMFSDQTTLGGAAAWHAAEILSQAIQERGEANIMVATGNSQLAFMSALRENVSINWSKITLFHLDEYLGISASHPASFRRFIREHLADWVEPRAAHHIEGDAPDPGNECRRYADLLRRYPIDLCCCGIGENGHLAFNDPPVADFDDPLLVKVVELDQASRRQQVGEGHFATLADVPTHALTVTIPAMLSARQVLVIAPEARKAKPVYDALLGPISTGCPASILRLQPHAVLYLDRDSAALLPKQPGRTERS